MISRARSISAWAEYFLLCSKPYGFVALTLDLGPLGQQPLMIELELMKSAAQYWQPLESRYGDRPNLAAEHQLVLCIAVTPVQSLVQHDLPPWIKNSNPWGFAER